MFQIVVFSKPLEEMAEPLLRAAKEAAYLARYSGKSINQELVSVEDVLLQKGEAPKHQIMIRHFPDFELNHTHFVFIGDEFTQKELEQAVMTYVSRPAALIDRKDPAQLMGAVMGHYYNVVSVAVRGEVKGIAEDGWVTLLIEGVGILNEMLVIKAAIDKEV